VTEALTRLTQKTLQPKGTMASGGGPRPLIAKGQDGSEMDVSRWVVVYPCYIDESKSRAGGRKLPKEACEGCKQASGTARIALASLSYNTGTDVHFVDMMGCCESLKLKACAEVRPFPPWQPAFRAETPCSFAAKQAAPQGLGKQRPHSSTAEDRWWRICTRITAYK